LYNVPFEDLAVRGSPLRL